ILAEERQLAIAVLLVEFDDLFQGVKTRAWAEPRQISIQIGLELVQKDLKFRVVKLSGCRNVSGIDYHGAKFFQLANQVVHQLIDAIVETKRFPGNSQPRPAQSILVEELCVVGEKISGADFRRSVIPVNAGQGAQQNRSIADRAGHGAGGILAVGNWNYAGAANEANR